MTPFRLGISIGTSGTKGFSNFAKTGAAGFRAAGLAGQRGAGGVGAFTNAVQKQAGTFSAFNKGVQVFQPALLGVGQGAQKVGQAVGVLGQGFQKTVIQSKQLAMQNQKTGLSFRNLFQASQVKLGATPIAPVVPTAPSPLTAAQVISVASVRRPIQPQQAPPFQPFTLGVKPPKPIQVAVSANTGGATAALQGLLGQVNALQAKAAGLRQQNQQTGLSFANLFRASQSNQTAIQPPISNPVTLGGMQGIAALQQRIQNAQSHAAALARQNQSTAASFSSIGRASQIAGAMIKGFGLGGMQAMGNLRARVNEIPPLIGNLGNKMAGLGQTVSRSIFSFQTLAATVGAGFLGAKLLSSNSALEQQKLSLAALISSNTDYIGSNGKAFDSTESLTESLVRSGNLINLHRRDAMVGAGTTEERVLVTNATIGKVIGEAGGNLQTVRGLANEVVTVSKLIPNLAKDADQAARDAGLILAGNANNDTALFSFLKDKLGMEAEAFNKLAAPERLLKFRAALQSIATPALVAQQAATFDGLVSSIQDFGKSTLQILGGPLFKQVKLGMAGVMDFLVNKDGSPTKAAQEIEKVVSKVADGVGFLTGKLIKGISLGGTQLFDFINKSKPAFDQFVIGVKNGFNDYIKPAIDAVIPIFTGFFDAIKEGVTWVSSNIGDMFGLVADNSGGVNTNLQTGIKTLAEFTVGAAGFIALGFATVIGAVALGVAAIGIGLKTSIEGFGILATETEKRGGGVIGFGNLMSEAWEGAVFIFNESMNEIGKTMTYAWEGAGIIFNDAIIKPVQGFFLGLAGWANNGFNQAYMSVLQFANKTIELFRSTPLLGQLLGSGFEVAGITSGLNLELAKTQKLLDEYKAAQVANAAANVQVTVQQTITAPNPQAAANAANLGVKKAVALGIPGAGRVGKPLVPKTAGTP